MAANWMSNRSQYCFGTLLIAPVLFCTAKTWMLCLLRITPLASCESVPSLVSNLADFIQVRHKIRRLGRNQQEGSKVRYRSPRRNNSMSVSDSNVSLTPSGPADLTTATFAKASVSAAAARVLEDFEFPRPESALLLLETHQERPGRTSLPAQAEANCGAAVKESSSLSLHLTPPVEGRLAASHSNLQETSTATDGSKDSIMSAATQRKTCPASSATIFDNSVPVGQYSVGYLRTTL